MLIQPGMERFQYDYESAEWNQLSQKKASMVRGIDRIKFQGGTSNRISVIPSILPAIQLYLLFEFLPFL